MTLQDTTPLAFPFMEDIKVVKRKRALCLDRTSVGRGEVLHPRGLAVAVEAYVML